MTDKELKRLNRKELLEILISQGREIDRLQSVIETAEERKQDIDIKLAEAGTIADAALSLSGVYEAADAAAQQYLENIKRCSEQKQADYDKTIADAEQKAADIISNAEKRAESIIEKAEKESARKQQEADKYWKQLNRKLEEFYNSHPGMSEKIREQMHKK